MRRWIAVVAVCVLWLTMVAPPAPSQELEPELPPAGWVSGTCNHIRMLNIEYLSDATLELCELVVPQFRDFKDRLHALFVIEGESGGDCLANDRAWGHLSGGRPVGCWSFMTHLNWDLRLFGRDVDEYDVAAASRLAAELVYNTRSGWFHWWSIHRAFNRWLPRYGIDQVWYCPPAEYWLNVPNGSNFLCGGRTYSN